MVAATIDWTLIIVNVIATIPAVLSAVLIFLVRRDVKTPSGETIGTVAEKALDLTAADLAMTTRVHDRVVDNGPRGGR